MIHNKNFPFDKDDDSEIIHIRPSSTGNIRKFLFFAALISIASVAINYIFFSRGVSNPADAPFIVANPEPFRKKPSDPGGMDIPHIDKEIYENFDDSSQNSSEKIIPTAPPEKPIYHDSITDLIDSDEKKQKLPSESLTKKEVTTTKDSKPKVYKISSDGKVEVIKKTSTENKKTVDVNKILARQKTPEYWAQLGSFATEQDATKAWQQMREKNADIVGNTSIKISRSELGTEGTSFRLQAGPISNEQEAKDFCRKLNEREKSCFYVQGGAN